MGVVYTGNDLQAQVPFNLPANKPAANIVAMEYFLDNDPGIGAAASIPVTPATDYSQTFPVSIAGLATGPHYLYTRAKDAQGSWSQTNSNIFFVFTPMLPVNTSVADITGAEYFVDTDPGVGNGIPMPLTPASDVTTGTVAVNITGLANGVHHIFFRTRDSRGFWGLTTNQRLSIVVVQLPVLPATPVSQHIARLEYFIDADPGFGKGTIVNVSPGPDVSNVVMAADITGLSNGSHTFYVRTADSWSLTSAKQFTVGSNPLPVSWVSFTAKKKGSIVALEWQVANETGNEAYAVERSSNGTDFSELYNLRAAASHSLNHYSFDDEQPLSGVTYYRVRQTDADGSYSFSPTVAVRVQAPSVVACINNPVQHQLVIRSGTGYSADAALTVTDANGKQVLRFTYTGQPVDVSALAPGIYFLNSFHNGVAETIRFVKQ